MQSSKLQIKGFSSVWIIKWVFKFPFSLKHLLQNVYLYDFSPVWVLKWIFNLVNPKYYFA